MLVRAQTGDDLDAADQLVVQFRGDLGVLEDVQKDTVDAEAEPYIIALRLDMDVGGAGTLGGLYQQVHQGHGRDLLERLVKLFPDRRGWSSSHACADYIIVL